MISFSQFLAEAEAEKVITTKEEAQKQLNLFFRNVTSIDKKDENRRLELAMPLDKYIDNENTPSLFTLTYKYDKRGLGEEQFDITINKKSNELTVRNMKVGDSKIIAKETFENDGRTWTNLIIKEIVPLFNKLRAAHNSSNIGRDTGFTGHGSQDSGPY